MIMEGEVDEYPEMAFNLVGTIEEAMEKGKKLIAEWKLVLPHYPSPWLTLWFSYPFFFFKYLLPICSSNFQLLLSPPH